MALTAVSVSPAARFLLFAVLVFGAAPDARFLLFAVLAFGAAVRLLALLRPSATLDGCRDQQAEEEAQAVEERSLQPTRGVSYSIFLSHSRKQKGFVERLNEHLVRAGQYTFFDVHSIPKGVAFPQYIMQAAIHSKLGVVTLSDDFMSSKWPMIELELFTNSAAQVVPLYYKLSPDDLKSPKKLETWKKQWLEMARKDRTIDVSKWEKAVRDLALQNGEIYCSETSEGAYMKTVVRKICEQLPPRVIYHLPYVKGQIRFIQELQTQFQRKRVIGMHGVGGQGKTTLCCVMSNFYKSTSALEPVVLEFPSDEGKDKIVNECKKVLKRLDLVNKELLEDVDCFDKAMQVMKDRMKGQRIFLALDNVWDHCQKEASEILKVGFDAKEGFDPDSKVLVTSRSEELLKGLLTKFDKALVRPLISVNEDEALEIFGASFEGDISFASRTLLDRALSLCRFSGSYHPIALQSLGEKLKYMGGTGDRNAIEGNLARISSDLKGGETIDKLIKMNYDSRNCVGKKMFLDVAVVFRRTRSFKLTYGDIEFEEMRNWLRSLYEDECAGDEIDIQLHRLALAGLVQFEGDGMQRTVRIHDLYVSLAKREAAASSRILLPENMEAVKWAELERVVLDTRCEETVELQLCPKLQLLYASGQKFSKGLQLEGATALRLLKVVDCIGKLSGLKGVPKLEALHLKAGSSSDGMEAILRDVRSCAPLKSLVLAGEGFRVVGEDDAGCLCALTNLRSIQLCGWKSLRELPDSTLGASGSPCNLEALHLWKCTRLQRIPDLGRFVQLHELDLRGCGALEDMGGMALPPKLVRLRVHACRRLQKIPDVGGCASLRELQLWGCEALEEIVGMALPSKLESLCLYDCRSLQKIPDVGGCASLRVLDLRGCEALEEIVGMALQSNLEILRLNECRSLQKIPGVGGCASLRVLDLCGVLEEMGGKTLPSKLERLRLHNCRRLQKIPDVGGCASLRELQLWGCEALEEIVGMPLPSKLESLCFYDCRSLQKIPDVGGCASLRVLELSGCGALQEMGGMALPSKLEWLRLHDCWRLQKIPDVGGCAALRVLHLQRCGALEEMSGRALLSNLETLRVDECRRLQKIWDVGRCASLRVLDLQGCEALEEIAGMALPSKLERLCLHYCRSLRKIPDVGRCASLQVLDLQGCEALEEIDGLALPSKLERLCLYDCRRLQKIPDVGGCASLQQLQLRRCESLEEIGDMVGCASLRVLELRSCEALEEIVGMALPSNLEILRVAECNRLQKIPDVGGCASLRKLELWRCETLEEIVGMAFPSNMEILRLSECRRLRKIPHVRGRKLLLSA